MGRPQHPHNLRRLPIHSKTCEKVVYEESDWPSRKVTFENEAYEDLRNFADESGIQPRRVVRDHGLDSCDREVGPPRGGRRSQIFCVTFPKSELAQTLHFRIDRGWIELG